MELKILSKVLLKDVPSASGMELLNDTIFVCCDDSSFVFQINHDGKIQKKIPLFENQEARIPKMLKPDFEAMFAIDNDLFLLGSGSAQNRNKMFVVNLKSEQIQEFSLVKLYDVLKYEAKLKPEEFNIEAAAVLNDLVYLMNRGDNSIFILSLESFNNVVFKNDELQEVEIRKYNLPNINGHIAGFSGACVFDDFLFFSASVENTSDWINDGEILGSFIGIINLCAPTHSDVLSVLVDRENKIEALAVERKEGDSYFLKAMTDNDDGQSLLMNLELIIK